MKAAEKDFGSQAMKLYSLALYETTHSPQEARNQPILFLAFEPLSQSTVCFSVAFCCRSSYGITKTYMSALYSFVNFPYCIPDSSPHS